MSTVPKSTLIAVAPDTPDYEAVLRRAVEDAGARITEYGDVTVTGRFNVPLPADCPLKGRSFRGELLWRTNPDDSGCQIALVRSRPWLVAFEEVSAA